MREFLLRIAMSIAATSFLFLRLPFGALRGSTQILVFSFGLFVFAPIFAAAQDAPPAEPAPSVENASPTEQVPPAEQAPPADNVPGEQVDPTEPGLEDTDLESLGAAETEEAAPDEMEPAGSETTPAEWDISRPCENVQHPYEADLCQQWRAAEAAQVTAEAAQATAEASARTAGLMRLLMLTGVLATLLLLAMFVPLLMAAFAARRAAKGGTAQAPKSHRVQEGELRAKESEMRAYVDADTLEFIETAESEGIVKVRVTLRNSGQTPALNLQSVAEVGIRDISDEDLLPIMPLPEPSVLDPARPRLGRDAIAVEIVSCEAPPKLADRVTNGDATILVWGSAEYMDVFDRRRKTTFQYLCNAETLENGQIFKPMSRGDENG